MMTIRLQTCDGLNTGWPEHHLISLAFEVGPQCVITGFEKGKQVPIIVWKTHDQKKTPDGEQRAGILGMFEE
jgi:hypothetical protein